MELDELRQISAKEELSLNFIAKDEMISRALLDLQGFDDIVLKGGTAINRVYLKNKRFSEDIDFDIIYKGNAKEALPRTKEIVNMLKGFSIERPRIMKNTIRYDVFYINPLNHKDRIRLEFAIIKNALNCSRRIVNFGFVPYESALLNVYDVEELILQKIACIMNRMEGKDFFDIYYLIDLPHKPINKLKKNEKEIIKRISIEEKQIKLIANITNHYLPRAKRPNWSIFLEELKEKIKDY
ncbi:nucleotidyl transferase AbiEii/AbiGii toxin family protein, partial [Candidatus Woesearchaeota archaeon]|nr:nucleotidyl transferase AbiEii/AbiGii toxin family protein [Candidatus Woesearchaeota archaeon]